MMETQKSLTGWEDHQPNLKIPYFFAANKAISQTETQVVCCKKGMVACTWPLGSSQPFGAVAVPRWGQMGVFNEMLDVRGCVFYLISPPFWIFMDFLGSMMRYFKEDALEQIDFRPSLNHAQGNIPR